jgi:predicted transglutaminase-like cysteine proteinase
MPGAAPIEFLALSNALNVEPDRASSDEFISAPAEPLALWHEFNPGKERGSFDVSALAPVSVPIVPVRRQVSADQNNSDKPSLAPITFASLPHRLKANVERISFDTPALAPMAFVRFCTRYPQDCKVRQTAFQTKPMVLDEARRAELVKVNRDVNRAIRPQENTNGVMAEEWLVSPREGDCNDYAVTKRHELLARGWPSRSLLLAEVVVASGEHHLILVVRTREEEVVLDNLNWNIRPVSQIHYQWVRAQQAENPQFWSSISVTTATQVAMNNR